LAKGLLDLDYSELARRLRESKSLYHNANVDIQDLLDRLGPAQMKGYTFGKVKFHKLAPKSKGNC
jgi:hypothetical protein